jgi:outer membrane protein assembly factor BamB
MNSRITSSLAAWSLSLCLLIPAAVPAADWPMWRGDAQRSGASPQELPAKLYVQWARDFPPLKPAWPDQAKMQFDVAYEPIVMGKMLYFGSPREDRVIALDTETGAEKWTFFTDGPIRFAPVAWEGRLFVGSDDGYLYCLDAAKGALLWKFRGGPSDRKILGNERLISTWPVRGAPVIADGTVYFAASIWPFMGIFIHALDARTGEVRWTNDGDGSIYMKQPHNTDAFAAVAPQGPMVVAGDRLLIPGGRSVPACYDRKTGKLLRYQLAENGKRGGGSDVAAASKVFFNGGAAFDIESEKFLGAVGTLPVVSGDSLYVVVKDTLKHLDIKNAKLEEKETTDKKGKKTKVTSWGAKEVASAKLPPLDCLIKAGSRLYAGAGNAILTLDAKNQKLLITDKTIVEGNVARLIAADNRLFAVTYEGRIYGFGGMQVDRQRTITDRTIKVPDKELRARVMKMLETAKADGGYAIVWGAGQPLLIEALLAQSSLRLVVVDPDANKVRMLREHLVDRKLYGERVAVHTGDPHSMPLPPYMASLIVCEDLQAIDKGPLEAVLPRIFATLRPFGGTACFLPMSGKLRTLAESKYADGLANARWQVSAEMVTLTRADALPGSANWTHENGDAANTRVSKDQLVKAPLGILWFGGPSHDGILPRHGHGPQPQVIDGRLIIEGVDLMRATDIYTGRLLWETKLPGVGAFYNNLAHQPGANSSGSNFISTSDGIYVAYGTSCVKLDPETGKKVRSFKLPTFLGMKESPRWGYLNVAGDYLVGGADPLFDPKLLAQLPKGTGDDPEPGAKEDNAITKLLKAIKAANDNMSSSRHLVVMDRETGKVLWTASAEHGFRHNGTCIGNGRLYTIDRLSGPQLSKLQRRGEEPKTPMQLHVFDLKTGKKLWSSKADIFGTWLSYSAKHDVLVEAGRVARDSLPDEPKGMRAYDAKTGKVLWFQKSYTGPAMIHGDTILQGQGACDLMTGAEKMRADPLTGELVPWTWTRTYGCNTPSASEHLLTFRSGAAGFFDFCNDGGTGNFGGFRSSCTNNLIVAGGVLTVPDYTRTCTCQYQNQSSVGLVPMPEAEMWTFFGTKTVKGAIRRIGINLGAPGDRRADDGTLWLEYPSTGGASPAVSVKTTGTIQWYRRHPSQVVGKNSWIGSSGAKGLTAIELAMNDADGPKRKFTIRLYFMEPDKMDAGERVFSVAVQGKEVVKDLDVVKEAGGTMRVVVKEFTGVEVGATLSVQLRATRGTPILGGIEAVEEK